MTTEQFLKFRRTQIAHMRPWVPGESMADISISSEDVKAGSPKAGDMIARNPKNFSDRWLVAAQYVADNFEPVPCSQCGGEGWTQDTGCCGSPLRSGECCGNGIAVQVQCEYCQATGSELVQDDVEHLDGDPRTPEYGVGF